MTLFLYSLEKAFVDHPETLTRAKQFITQFGDGIISLDQFVLEICRLLRSAPHLIKDFSQSGLIPEQCHVEWSGRGADQVPDAVAIQQSNTRCSIYRLDSECPTTLKVSNSTDLRTAIINLQVKTSNELIRAICEVNPSGPPDVERLAPSDASSLVVLFHFSLSTQPWSTLHRRLCHSFLRKLLQVHDALPPFFTTGNLVLENDHPISSGDFADNYLGSLNGQIVHIKVLRKFNSAEKPKHSIVKEFCNEAFIWRQLKHPNILPFLGVNKDQFPRRLCLISPYLSNGNVNDFLQSHPRHHRLSCVLQIATGMDYLHSLDICHGDIRGANILVDNDVQCCLADFGLTEMVDKHAPNISGPEMASRWAPPEVLTANFQTHTPATDVYSFGCTVIEIVTGRIPFPELADLDVSFHVVHEDARPSRPPTNLLPDQLWELLTKCWSKESLDRPTSSSIVNILSSSIVTQTSPSVVSPAVARSLPSIPQNHLTNSSAHDINQNYYEDPPPYTLEPSYDYLSSKVLVLVTRDWDNFLQVDVSATKDGGAIRNTILTRLKVYDELERSRLSIFQTDFQREVVGDALSDSQLLYVCATEGDDKGGLKFALIRENPSQQPPLPTRSALPSLLHDPHAGSTPRPHPAYLSPTTIRTHRPLPAPPSSTSTSSEGAPPSLIQHPSKPTDAEGKPGPRSLPAPSPVVERGRQTPSDSEILSGTSRNKAISPLSSRFAIPSRPWGIEDPSSVEPSKHTIKQTKSAGSLRPSGGRSVTLAVGRNKSTLPKVEIPSGPDRINYKHSSTSGRATLSDSLYASPTSLVPGSAKQLPVAVVLNGRALPPPSSPVPVSRRKEKLKVQTDFDVFLAGRTPPSTSPLARPAKETHSSRPNTSQGKGTWAPRPRPQAIAENIEKHFASYDVDEKIIESNSPSASPISVARPATGQIQTVQALTSSTTSDAASKRQSLRMLAQKRAMTEHLAAESRPEGPSRHTTKLWGIDAEEVKSEDLKGRRKSVPHSSFKCSWFRGELLGKGAYACVYLAMNANSGEMMAVKEVETSTPGMSSSSQQKEVVKALKREILTLKGLDHPHVVQYLGYQESPTNLTIFLEYVPGGTIGSCIRKYGKFPENTTKSFISQILDGLEYLHAKNVIHRDLKADNILLEESGVCKITDFGVSKRTKADTHTFQGSIYWMAPEIVRAKPDQGYNCKVDIWSVGCIALEMWTGERPWVGQNTHPVLIEIYQQKTLPPLPDGITLPNMAEDFRQLCFTFDPKERPSAAVLRKHPYLTLPPTWIFEGFE